MYGPPLPFGQLPLEGVAGFFPKMSEKNQPLNLPKISACS